MSAIDIVPAADTASIAFTLNPVAGTNIALNGTTITFVRSGAIGNQVNIGNSLAITLASLLLFLNTAGSPFNLATYQLVGTTLYAIPASDNVVLSWTATAAGTSIEPSLASQVIDGLLDGDPSVLVQRLFGSIPPSWFDGELTAIGTNPIQDVQPGFGNPSIISLSPLVSFIGTISDEILIALSLPARSLTLPNSPHLYDGITGEPVVGLGITYGSGVAQVNAQQTGVSGGAGTYLLSSLSAIGAPDFSAPININNGGHQYAVGDTITLPAGIILLVTGVNPNGIITSVSVQTGGVLLGGQTPPSNPLYQVSTSGSGNDAVFMVNWIQAWPLIGKRPNLYAFLSGGAYNLSWIYTLYQYTLKQARLASMTGVWLDRFAFDFFGVKLPRRSGELDNAYRLRIQREIFRQRQTRAGIIQALIDTTGFTPSLQELWNPQDVGAYDIGTSALDQAGMWGDLSLNNQIFITAFRPSGGGIAGAAGYDTGAGGYAALSINSNLILGLLGSGLWGMGLDTQYFGGNMEYVDDGSLTIAAEDNEIYSTIAKTIAAGITAWTAIQTKVATNELPMWYFGNVNSYLDIYSSFF